MTENENDGDAPNLVDLPHNDDANNDEDIQDLLYPTEAQKIERRQERNLLEKKGNKCRKEGCHGIFF